jgi:hypothetical protein
MMESKERKQTNSDAWFFAYIMWGCRCGYRCVFIRGAVTYFGEFPANSHWYSRIDPRREPIRGIGK